MTEAITRAPPMVKPPIVRKQRLTLKDLEAIDFPMQIQGDTIIIEQSPTGWKLQHPVTLYIDKVIAAREKGLIKYILNAFTSDRPALLPFVFENQSIIRMIRHFLRHCSGSLRSACTYTVNVQKYSAWLGYSPDIIIGDIKPVGNIPDPTRVQNHAGYLNDYLAELQDEGLKPGAVNNYVKAVKTFYRVNGAKVELTEPLSRRITYKDRAPKPEELTKLLDLSNLREKFIVSAFALAGFREETFSKLRYRHVRNDLENNRDPIHVHVEAEITKGKYHDYDTFLGAEASHFLRLYIDQRKKGHTWKGNAYMPPEKLTDESPLIRDEKRIKPKGIGTKQLRKLVHDEYLRAELIKKSNGRMYDLRCHSLRKFFKTQMLALGVQPDYVDYFMGHTVDTYHDIQSLGIEKLRNIYAASGLAIRKKTQVSKIDALKEIIRAWGMNPEQILTRDAFTDGATTYQNPEEFENRELQILSNQLKQLIRQEATV
jgi:site-specific recombinase XerD